MLKQNHSDLEKSVESRTELILQSLEEIFLHAKQLVWHIDSLDEVNENDPN